MGAVRKLGDERNRLHASRQGHAIETHPSPTESRSESVSSEKAAVLRVEIGEPFEELRCSYCSKNVEIPP